MNDLNRRDFIRKSLAGGMGLGLAGMQTASAQEDNTPAIPHNHKVPRKQLGATGEDVPILHMGCAQKFDAKYDKRLHRAYEEGVNYLDTALKYDKSHVTLAPFIKQVGRKNLWITSKAPSKEKLFGISSVAQFSTNLDKCLEELEIDYLDLLFMHAISSDKLLAKEYIQMGEAFKRSKKIRFFGFSCHGGNVAALMNKAAEVGGIDAIMFRYSYAQYGDTKLSKAIDACKKAGIGLIAMKTQKAVPKDTRDTEKIAAFQSENFTLAQAKLKAVWADERIDTVVSHMTSVQQVAENVAAAKSIVPLTAAELSQLQQMAAHTAQYACEGCEHLCEPMINADVKVADILRYLMYHECYHEPERARSLYAKLSPAQRTIRDVDFRKAARACPQGIDIASRLAHAENMMS